MRLKFSIKVLLWLSGAIAGTAVEAAGIMAPLLDADNPASSNISQQIQEGVTRDIGLSPPAIDNVIKQGIRMPQEPESSAGDKEVEGKDAGAESGKLQEKKANEERKP